jgi:hypothetical protein
MEFNVGETPYATAHKQYRTRPVLQLLGVIDYDAPPARSSTPPPPRMIAQQAGPSKTRKVEVIDIDAEDKEEDLKPEIKPLLTTRVGWLEVRVLLYPRVCS